MLIVANVNYICTSANVSSTAAELLMRSEECLISWHEIFDIKMPIVNFIVFLLWFNFSAITLGYYTPRPTITVLYLTTVDLAVYIQQN